MNKAFHFIRQRIYESTTDSLRLRSPLIANQSGSLFVGLIVAMAILAVAGTAMLSLTATSTFTELAANRHNAAYYIAESGGRYAIPQIQSDLNLAITNLDGRTFTLADGQRFSLLIDDTSPNLVFLTSKGEVSTGSWAESSSTIIYRFSISYDSYFDRAAFADGKIQVKKNSYIDSYDPIWTGEGDGYDDQNPLFLAGTNGGVGDISVHHDATLYGLAATNEGRTLTPETPPAIYDNLVINGNNYSSGDSPVFSGDSQTISTGTYQLSGLTLTDENTLTISGDVTLYVSNTTKVSVESSIELNSGATLTLYLGNTLTIWKGSSVNSGGSPSNMRIYGTATADKITIKKSSSLTGLIYAPTAQIKIMGQGEPGSGNSYNGLSEIFGSVFGDKVQVHKGGSIHYDERLSSFNLPGSTFTLEPPIQYFKN